MLKEFTKNALVEVYTLGAFSKLRAKVQKKTITILLYHEIESSRLEEHLTFLLQTHTPIELVRLRNALLEKNPDVLPTRSLLVTFDDGWKSNINILAIARKLKVRPTIFLTAGLIGTNRKIWNYIDNGNLRNNYSLNTKLKNIPNKEKDRFLLERYGYHVKKEYVGRKMMTEKEIRQMLPFIDFQSHGMFHPVFTMCTKEELHFELTESRKIIENITGKPCYAIAYPYGRCRMREIQAAQNAGYEIGRTANQAGLNKIDTNPMVLKSVGIRNFFNCRKVEKTLAWAEIKTILTGRCGTRQTGLKIEEEKHRSNNLYTGQRISNSSYYPETELSNILKTRI